ncbi:piRNA biogenesis EXD1 [Solea senegalensis]|nr:piRNA biogenesis EXD1 [Solea senegalensis]
MTIDHDEGEEECIDFIVIDEFHEKFAPAVIHIKKQHVIGVGANGVEVFKHGRLCWLQIATKNKVYLFDVLLLGGRAFKNGLSSILESEGILKVMHDCRAIAGCLVAQFGVKLTNVFDTQVADVMCFHTETGGFLPDRVSTLQEVVSLHLKVPPSQLVSLQIQSQLTKEENEMWYVRPCPVALLKVMALSVIHLQPLRLVLLDTLMTDYMTLVDSYITNSHFDPEDLENVGKKSVLALPKELRQLQQMHLERQERATNHYPVTEEGLLARFKPRTKSPPQTSPSPEEKSQAQAESFGPATVELPSSAQQEQHPRFNQQPASPIKVTSVSSLDVCASPDPAAHAPVAPTVAAFEITLPSVSTLSVGMGCTEELMNTIGRGKPFGKEQSTPCALPGIGRGFLFQMPPAQFTRESSGCIKSLGLMEMTPSCPSLTPSLKTMPQPDTGACATDLPKDTFGLREDLSPATTESLLSSLTQSFRSFRH